MKLYPQTYPFLYILFMFQFFFNSCQSLENEQVKAEVFEKEISESGAYLGIKIKNASQQEVHAMKARLTVSDIFEDTIKEQIIKLDDLEGKLKPDSTYELSLMINLSEDAFINKEPEQLKFSLVIDKVIYKEY